MPLLADEMTLSLGIDIGTSGVRTAVLDMQGTFLSQANVRHRPQTAGTVDARQWWDTVRDCVRLQVSRLKAEDIDPHAITHAAIDGTSGTMVLVDDRLEPVTPALMYDTKGFEAEAAIIVRFAPQGSITIGSNSATARLLRLQALDTSGRSVHLMHQADYVLAKFCGQAAGSDDNNALKTGFDPALKCWPDWFEQAGICLPLLPSVRAVGAPAGLIDSQLAGDLGLFAGMEFRAGTTDSVAAFVASGANQVGDGVTSLGTTMAFKLLADRRIDDAASGIYSHKLGSAWLVGGASNSGGGVLAAFFSHSDLVRLSKMIKADQPTGLDYYPLNIPGERFPINDPNFMPRMTPRPEQDEIFLQGLLEGMARIEHDSYAALSARGAPQLKRLFTAGGGTANQAWAAIRKIALGCPFEMGRSQEAAFGTAMIALKGHDLT